MTDNPTTFVGSHEKAENDYGQNGSDQQASLTPGQTKPDIADVSVPTRAVPGLSENDKLNARVTGSAVPLHNGLNARGPESGSPGGKVPSNNRPVTQPAPQGAFKRD